MFSDSNKLVKSLSTWGREAIFCIRNFFIGGWRIFFVVFMFFLYMFGVFYRIFDTIRLVIELVYVLLFEEFFYIMKRLVFYNKKWLNLRWKYMHHFYTNYLLKWESFKNNYEEKRYWFQFFRLLRGLWYILDGIYRFFTPGYVRYLYIKGSYVYSFGCELFILSRFVKEKLIGFFYKFIYYDLWIWNTVGNTDDDEDGTPMVERTFRRVMVIYNKTYFYVWLKRSVEDLYRDLMATVFGTYADGSYDGSEVHPTLDDEDITLFDDEEFEKMYFHRTKRFHMMLMYVYGLFLDLFREYFFYPVINIFRFVVTCKRNFKVFIKMCIIFIFRKCYECLHFFNKLLGFRKRLRILVLIQNVFSRSISVGLYLIFCVTLFPLLYLIDKLLYVLTRLYGFVLKFFSYFCQLDQGSIAYLASKAYRARFYYKYLASKIYYHSCILKVFLLNFPRISRLIYKYGCFKVFSVFFHETAAYIYGVKQIGTFAFYKYRFYIQRYIPVVIAVILLYNFYFIYSWVFYCFLPYKRRNFARALKLGERRTFGLFDKKFGESFFSFCSNNIDHHYRILKLILFVIQLDYQWENRRWYKMRHQFLKSIDMLYEIDLTELALPEDRFDADGDYIYYQRVLQNTFKYPYRIVFALFIFVVFFLLFSVHRTSGLYNFINDNYKSHFEQRDPFKDLMVFFYPKVVALDDENHVEDSDGWEHANVHQNDIRIASDLATEDITYMNPVMIFAMERELWARETFDFVREELNDSVRYWDRRWIEVKKDFFGKGRFFLGLFIALNYAYSVFYNSFRVRWEADVDDYAFDEWDEDNSVEDEFIFDIDGSDFIRPEDIASDEFIAEQEKVLMGRTVFMYDYYALLGPESIEYRDKAYWFETSMAHAMMCEGLDGDFGDPWDMESDNGIIEMTQDTALMVPSVWLKNDPGAHSEGWQWASESGADSQRHRMFEDLEEIMDSEENMEFFVSLEGWKRHGNFVKPAYKNIDDYGDTKGFDMLAPLVLPSHEVEIEALDQVFVKKFLQRSRRSRSYWVYLSTRTAANKRFGYSFAKSATLPNYYNSCDELYNLDDRAYHVNAEELIRYLGVSSAEGIKKIRKWCYEVDINDERDIVDGSDLALKLQNMMLHRWKDDPESKVGVLPIVERFNVKKKLNVWLEENRSLWGLESLFWKHASPEFIKKYKQFFRSKRMWWYKSRRFTPAYTLKKSLSISEALYVYSHYPRISSIKRTKRHKLYKYLIQRYPHIRAEQLYTFFPEMLLSSTFARDVFALICNKYSRTTVILEEQRMFSFAAYLLLKEEYYQYRGDTSLICTSPKYDINRTLNAVKWMLRPENYKELLFECLHMNLENKKLLVPKVPVIFQYGALLTLLCIWGGEWGYKLLDRVMDPLQHYSRDTISKLRTDVWVRERTGYGMFLRWTYFRWSIRLEPWITIHPNIFRRRYEEKRWRGWFFNYPLKHGIRRYTSKTAIYRRAMPIGTGYGPLKPGDRKYIYNKPFHSNVGGKPLTVDHYYSPRFYTTFDWYGLDLFGAFCEWFMYLWTDYVSVVLIRFWEYDVCWFIFLLENGFVLPVLGVMLSTLSYVFFVIPLFFFICWFIF